MNRRARSWWVTAGGVVLLTVAMLGADAGPAQSQAKRSVTLRLSWTIFGLHAPFFLAVEKGYYAAEGLDVKIFEGKGSVSTVQLVANKSDTFGFPDATTIATASAQGAPVKAVMSMVQKNPLVITYLEKAGLTTPQSLVGKRIAGTPGESIVLIFPAYLRLHNIEPEKVTIVGMEPNAKPRAVLQGAVDGQLDYLTAFYPALKQQNPSVRVQKFSDFGMETMLTQSMIAHNDLIKSDPDLVRRFVAASVKGWQRAKSHPEEAAAALKKAHPVVNEAIALEQIKSNNTLLQTSRSAGHVLGWAAKEDWELTLDLAKKYAGFKGDPKADVYFTNDFLPKD